MKYDYKNSSNLKLFAQHYKGHLGLFTIDMCCALLVSAIDLTFPMISRMSMNYFLPNKLYHAFFAVMMTLVLAYAVKAALYFVITYWGHRMGTYIEADLRDELFAHIETLSFSFFDKNRTGQLMSRVTNDLFEITELSHHGPEDLFISSVTIIGAICILSTIEWRLALLVFVVIPCFVVFTVIVRKKMRQRSIEVKARTSEINATIESGFSGIRTAKAFANEDIEIEKFHQSSLQYVDAKKDYYKTMGIFMSGMEFALSILSVLVITAGGFFIMGGSMDLVDLVTFTLYVSIFISPVRKLVAFIEQYMYGMAGFGRFVEIMRIDPEVADKEDAFVLEDVKGDIHINDVSFSYAPTNDNEEAPEVLNHVNIDIPAGSCFAVVGPSGGGKTTLCHLIPRFYDVTDGSITVDGHDVRDVTQKSLRQSIGIVQQDVFMFAGTIRENIAYGKPDATFEEIVDAAKRAEIHNEIIKMPNGYDSYIGERGVMLSGGQKQRIGIARVFLKNPPVIILDEATSALDSMTEIRIQSAFDELAKGRTSIIIAHRLSTIRNADNIAVIDHNRVVEIGSHADLIALGGEYADLVNAQAIAGSTL